MSESFAIDPSSPHVSIFFKLCRQGSIESVHSYILEHPEMLFARDQRGNTAMHHAAACNRNYVVDLLVAYGQSTQIKNHSGSTALHIACYRGAINAVQAIFAERFIYWEGRYAAFLSERNHRSWTPMRCAAEKGHNNIVNFLYHRTI